MNWRRWAYLKLIQSTAVTALVPAASIMAGGSLTGSPASRPFIVIRLGNERPELKDDERLVATSRVASIWVYDEPGSYDLIDDIIEAVRDTLIGQVGRVIELTGGGSEAFEGGIVCAWANDSDELADDVLASIVRNSNYRLVGSQS